jgi:hypothetical protein
LVSFALWLANPRRLNSSLIPVRSSISSTNGVPPERQLLSSNWDKKKHKGSSLKPNKKWKLEFSNGDKLFSG